MHNLTMAFLLVIVHGSFWKFLGMGVFALGTVTASIKHTWSLSIKNDAGSAVVADAPLVLVGRAEHNFEIIVPATETGEVDMPVTVLDIVSGFVSCTGTGTIKTNAADAAGGQTFTFAPPARAVSWNNQLGTACPFDPDITKFFCHNTGTGPATFRGGFLIDE